MHRVRGKHHYRRASGGVTRIEIGEPIEPTEAELAAFSDRFVEIETDGTAEAPVSETPTTEETEKQPKEKPPETKKKPKKKQASATEISREYPDLSELTVTEGLTEYLKENDFTDAEKDELHRLEEAGENRSTAHTRIEQYCGED